MLKKNKGITLIALIITIIIMLILVAVSIDLIVNDKLFNSAGDAVSKTNEKVGQQQNRVNELMGILGEVESNSEDTELSNIKIKLTMTHKETPVTVDGTKVKEIKEGAPIPVDFYYVGGTKNTGIVISDDSSDANKGENANLVGNQFVWVPVLQNQKLKIEIESKEAITGIKIEDPLLNEITTDKDGNTLTPTGTSYTVETNPNINGTYTVTVNAGEDTNTETIRVSSLYAQDINIPTKEEYMELVKQVAQEQGVTIEKLLENIFGPGATIDSAYSLEMSQCQGYTDSTISTYYNNSVNTYGGFYIARYEAGCESKRTSSGAGLGTVYSKKNMYPYNYVTQTQAMSQSTNMYNKASVTSSLTNAAAWDRTLNWLVETNAVNRNEIFADSTSWGNYDNSTFNFTGKYSVDDGQNYIDASSSTEKPENKSYLLGTGITDYTKRNNIYDLAGNCCEWTTEAYSSGNVVYRGGNYDGYGNYNPASVRLYDSADSSDVHISFRPSLYVK